MSFTWLTRDFSMHGAKGQGSRKHLSVSRRKIGRELLIMRLSLNQSILSDLKMKQTSLSCRKWSFSLCPNGTNATELLRERSYLIRLGWREETPWLRVRSSTVIQKQSGTQLMSLSLSPSLSTSKRSLRRERDLTRTPSLAKDLIKASSRN